MTYSPIFLTNIRVPGIETAEAGGRATNVTSHVITSRSKAKIRSTII